MPSFFFLTTEFTSPMKKNGNLSSDWQQLQSWCQWSVSQNKFETFQQCIKSTHNASIISSIIAVKKWSFQSFYFQLTGLFIKIKQKYHQTCMYWLQVLRTRKFYFVGNTTRLRKI
jgi:hypothetical protein